MRRGEVPFVASPVGRETDALEVLGLAHALKVRVPEALGLVTLWESLILRVGDAQTGKLPHDYEAQHIAVSLQWYGSPAKLVTAMKAAGVLRRQRRTWFHPYWRKTITGQYAADRAFLRQKWRDKKRTQRQGQGGDVPGDWGGQAGDVPSSSSEKMHINQSINGNGGASPPVPSPSPPGAGGSLGETRWNWMLQNHERPVNQPACVRLLGLMSDEEWADLLYALSSAGKASASKSRGKKRALRLDSHKFLLTTQYLQWRRERVAKLAQPEDAGEPSTAAPPDTVTGPSSPEDSARRAVEFILAQLADPELTEEERALARARWRKLHPDNPEPWKEGGP